VLKKFKLRASGCSGVKKSAAKLVEGVVAGKERGIGKRVDKKRRWLSRACVG